jgi:hypothetical protein
MVAKCKVPKAREAEAMFRVMTYRSSKCEGLDVRRQSIQIRGHKTLPIFCVWEKSAEVYGKRASADSCEPIGEEYFQVLRLEE